MVKKLRIALTILSLLFDVVLYFVLLPAINFHSAGFLSFLIVCVVPQVLLRIDFKKSFQRNGALIAFCVILVAVIFLSSFIGTPVLGGLQNYTNRINIPESSDFSDIEEFDETQVQIIDKEISMSLADRVFGEMGADVVSQYEMSSNYSSVVVNNTMYRLTPVEYAGFIKWLSTNNSGTPGFISVNVTTGETEFHELNEGLKYTQNAKLLNNLTVHLRLQYPTYIFGYSKFEVDDNWNPYWVSQVMDYDFVGKSPDVKGVVITNPITGESNYYDAKEVPSWVDNVFDANLISDQYNSYGTYINGLFNFSQRGQTAVTDDYAYLQKNGHLWMYTGVTSVGTDESNVGFIYVDLQNKDVIYIISAGAEEYSARASAQGTVQEKGYTAVFPTIVNIDNEPVYFMGLKDNAGLIKAYAFVSYKNYQKVGVGTSINEALKSYTGKTIINNDETQDLIIEVKQIQSAVVDGDTIYYLLTSDNTIYTCNIEVSDKLPFVVNGNRLKVKVVEKQIIELISTEAFE